MNNPFRGQLFQINPSQRISLLQDCAEQRTKKTAHVPAHGLFFGLLFLDFLEILDLWQDVCICDSAEFHLTLDLRISFTITFASNNHQSLETLLWIVGLLNYPLFESVKESQNPKDAPQLWNFVRAKVFSHTECQKNAVCWLDFSVASHRMRKGVYRRILVCIGFYLDYRPQM